jgi:glycosyltransferase involved in cell wall biosynthesis
VRFVLDARYAGPRTSGIGIYVRGIGSRLPAHAPSARFRFWIRPRAKAISEAPNAEHHVVRAAPAGVSSLLWPRRLDRLEGADLVHLPANILGFGIENPTVVTVHDVMWLDHLDWCQPNPLLRPVSRAYYGTAIRRALRFADRILTVSRASADAILRIAPEAARRVVVTPNACEPHFRAPASTDDARARAASVLRTQAPFFLVVGQNQPSKAHDVAVRAFAAAAPHPHRLVLIQRLNAGGGLRGLIRDLGIEDRVDIRPSLAIDDLIALLQSATALLQPSLAEGFGLPALEAMASGCPVIASEIPPLREILGDAGLFASPGSVSSLSEVIRAALAAPSKLEENRAKGLERAGAFSWDRSTATTWEVYREVSRAGGRSA